MNAASDPFMDAVAVVRFMDAAADPFMDAVAVDQFMDAAADLCAPVYQCHGMPCMHEA